MPGKPVFRAGQEIKGEFTEIQGCDEPVYEAPRVNISRPILRYESHERLIGMISKGVKGLDILAMVGTGILLFNPATTWVAIGLEIAKDSALAAIGGAMLTSVASQAVGSTVAHRGNLKQVGRDLTSKGMAVDLFATLVTGGGSGGSLTFLQQAGKQATRAITRAGLNIVILGQKPREAFKEALTSAAVNTVAAYTAGKIGQAYKAGYGPLDPVTHKLLHGGVGALTGALIDLKGDPLRSAASGALGAIIAETVADVLTRQPHEALLDMMSEAKAEGRELTRQQYLQAYQDEVDRHMDMGRLCAGITAVLTRGDASLAIMTANNALENNFAMAIPVAAALTPEMLAGLGLGITGYQLGQWLKDQPFVRDMLPEGVLWEDKGFMPEENQGQILITPGHDNKSLIFFTPPADRYSLTLQTPVYDGPDLSVLFKKSENTFKPAIKQRLKEAHLPLEGKIRFIPPKGYNPKHPLIKGPNHGYFDRFGNEWMKGSSRTEGQAFEWDVQLSKTGVSKLGWLSRDGKHINVSLDGKITHK